jgi:hypothetical protein
MGSLTNLPLVQIVNNYLDELTSSDLNIRFNSADSLRKIFANTSSNGASLSVKENAIAPMIEALSLDDSPTCDRIVWALECIGESAIKALISATQSRIGKVQIQSIHALGRYISFPELRFRALEILHQGCFILISRGQNPLKCLSSRI